MALSNILKEPRREITETLVGIAVLALPVYADWQWSGWFMHHENDPTARGVGMVIGVLVCLVGGLLVCLVGGLIIVGIHALGDAICNLLDRHGLPLRPTQRYR